MRKGRAFSCVAGPGLDLDLGTCSEEVARQPFVVIVIEIDDLIAKSIAKCQRKSTAEIHAVVEIEYSGNP